MRCWCDAEGKFSDLFEDRGLGVSCGESGIIYPEFWSSFDGGEARATQKRGR